MFRIARCPRCSKMHEVKSFTDRRLVCNACHRELKKQHRYVRHVAVLDTPSCPRT